MDKSNTRQSPKEEGRKEENVAEGREQQRSQWRGTTAFVGSREGGGGGLEVAVTSVVVVVVVVVLLLLLLLAVAVVVMVVVEQAM